MIKTFLPITEAEDSARYLQRATAGPFPTQLKLQNIS